MKKLLVTIISSSILSFSALASERLDLSKFVNSDLQGARLFDGRSIDFKKEVEAIHLYKKQIDYIELLNGEVVDRTDIKLIQLLDRKKLMLVKTGVDGGG